MYDVTRALVWKEWREQQGVVLAGLALAVSSPFVLMAASSLSTRGVDLQGLAEAMPFIVGIFLWPLFGAACGAITISNEISEETLGFLLSRPVSRTRVWTLKVVVGLAALSAIITGSLVVVWVFGAAVGSDGFLPLLKIMELFTKQPS